MRKHSTAYIYLIKCEDESDQIKFKIGYTKGRVEKRLKQLQTGSTYRLSIQTIFETKYGMKVETTLHNMYAHNNILNEWYILTNEQVINFNNTCKKIEKNFDFLKQSKNHYFK